jgi:type I restriction enzyme M protein
MLDVTTKNRINSARDMLVGKVPNPISQVQQITFALIYKFMNDMDKQNLELGGDRGFFKGELEAYAWDNLISNRIEATPALELYSQGLEKLAIAEHIPPLFRKMFKNAFIPYKNGTTFKSFIKIINEFDYKHSEKLGDAFEFLLSVLGSQGDAGMFRTPRHIIDFMVELMNPQKSERVLDPACGTAGFLISAYKHILKNNSSNYNPKTDKPAFEATAASVAEIGYGDEDKHFSGDKLKSDDRAKLNDNIFGYDISPEMVQFSLVNFFLHQCPNPQVFEYDSLTSTDRWGEDAEVILANPPFMTPKGGIRPHDKFGVKSNRAEVLFVDYIAEHLSLHGRAAIIVPEGVIFQSANAYKQLRQKLIEKNFLAGVISLPAGIFNPYSGVKTSILWLDRTLATKTDKIFFAKITADGFDLGAQRRPNNKNDLPAIFRAAKEYSAAVSQGKAFDPASHTQTTLVEKTKIAENGEYNFSADRYLEAKVTNSDYPMVSFGEVCEINPKKNEVSKVDSETEVSFVPMADIQENNPSFVPTQSKPISELLAGSYTYFRNGDILLAKVTPCFENGKAAIANNLKNQIGFGSSEYYVLRPTEKILPEIVYLLVTSGAFRAAGKMVMTGTGGLQRIPKEFVSKYQIPLPPLEVQQEIVAEVEGYQTIIDAARKITTTYKPRITLNPAWPVVELGSLATTQSGGTPSKQNAGYWEGEIPWVSPKDMKVDFIEDTEDHISQAAVSDSATKLVDRETLLCVVRSGILQHSLPLAITKRPMCFNQDIVAIKPDPIKLNVYYLFYLLRFQDQKVLREGIKPGVTVQSFHSGFFKSYPIPLPPLDEQKQIVAEIEAEQAIINANKKLIELFEAKIHRTLTKIWGDAEPEAAA